MLAKNVKCYKDNKKPLRCSQCDAPGYTIDKCIQIIGYPPRWRGTREVKNKADGNYNANDMVKSPVEEESTTSNLLFTQELFE